MFSVFGCPEKENFKLIVNFHSRKSKLEILSSLDLVYEIMEYRSVAKIIFSFILALSNKDVKGCCKWSVNTSLATITNQTQAFTTGSQTECCLSCMGKQLNNSEIKFAIYSEQDCYCMYDGPKTKAAGFQTTTVYSRVIWFEDDANDTFIPNDSGNIHINFCAAKSHTDMLELLPIDLSQTQNYTDAMYFYPPFTSLYYLKIPHPKTKRPIKLSLPYEVNDGIITTQIKVPFKIGTMDEPKEFLLALTHSSPGSIKIHFKRFNINNVTKNAFIAMSYSTRTYGKRFIVGASLSNSHLNTNADLGNSFLTFYYDNKTLSLEKWKTSAFLAELIQYGMHPITFQSSTMYLGSSFAANVYFEHSPNALDKYRLNVLIESQAPANKMGILHEKVFDAEDINVLYPHGTESNFGVKDGLEEALYTVYFIYLSDNILYCYHDQFRRNNFCAIYDLHLHQIIALSRLLLEPVGFKTQTDEFYFYDYFGTILVYDHESRSNSVTRNNLTEIMASDLVKPIKMLRASSGCCRLMTFVEQFNEGVTLNAYVINWSVAAKAHVTCP